MPERLFVEMINSNALVSVVIPTYNRAALLRRALESVVKQTYSNWEAIIVDNHSTDETDEIIRNFNDSRIKLFKIHNQGVIAASRNKGIREAKGEWVAFLDSDDWWKSEKLTLAVKKLESGYDVVYHDLIRIDNRWFDFLERKVPTRLVISPVYLDLLNNGNALVNSSVVVKRDLLLQINGFSENHDLVAAEDFDGWLRLAQITERFYRLPEASGYYWCAGGNTSSAERTLCSLDVIIKQHFSGQSDFSALPSWLQYSLIRAHFVLQDYKKVQHLGCLMNLGAPSLYFLSKIFYIRFFSVLMRSG